MNSAFCSELFMKSSILMLFYYLASLQNNSIVTSQCMQFIFGDKREVYLLEESALPVTKKESMQERKRSIGPRVRYGHPNLTSFYPHTNEQVCVFNLSSLYFCTCPLRIFVYVCLFYNPSL